MCSRWIKIVFLVGLSPLMMRTVCAQSDEGLARAGCPNVISKLAQVGYGKQYIVYYVGGGASLWKGEPRQCHEGTFGVDYQPIVPGFHRSVALRWWHGRRAQGGPGQYEPNDRVEPLPNLPHHWQAWHSMLD